MVITGIATGELANSCSRVCETIGVVGIELDRFARAPAGDGFVAPDNRRTDGGLSVRRN